MSALKGFCPFLNFLSGLCRLSIPFVTDLASAIPSFPSLHVGLTNTDSQCLRSNSNLKSSALQPSQLFPCSIYLACAFLSTFSQHPSPLHLEVVDGGGNLISRIISRTFQVLRSMLDIQVVEHSITSKFFRTFDFGISMSLTRPSRRRASNHILGSHRLS